MVSADSEAWASSDWPVRTSVSTIGLARVDLNKKGLPCPLKITQIVEMFVERP